MLRHKDIDETLTRLIGRKIKQSEIAEALFLTPESDKKEKTLASVRIGKRAQRNSPYSAEELYKLANYCYEKYGVDVSKEFDLQNTLEQASPTLQGRFYEIPYWDECPVFSEKLKDSQLSSLILDAEFIVNKLNCDPSALRIITMAGEDMDGGCYPLRNGDILLIDTSKTDLTETGVFFISTQNCSMVFVRRLLGTMAGDVYSTVDNPLYKEIVEKTWSAEEIKEIDLQIIGKVIKNMSFMI